LRPSQAQHDAALAQNQLRAIIDHGREIDQQPRNGSRFAAAPADDAQFVNPLARLALAAGELGEDRPLFVVKAVSIVTRFLPAEIVAQPRRPTFASHETGR
jgi:hypothetical protein